MLIGIGLSHTEKTSLGSLFTDSPICIEGRAMLSRSPPDTRQASYPTAGKRRIAPYRITCITSTGMLVIQLSFSKGYTNA